MGNNALYDRTIAFAGICQAVALVQQIAKNGECNTDAFKIALNAIMSTSPNSTLSVYGSETDLKIGLECLVRGIDRSPRGSEVARYIISLIAIERKLRNSSNAMRQLSERISILERQLDHFELLHEQMIGNLASVYLDVISPISPRIQVMGTPSVLQHKLNQHKVRALLLSGSRSTVLWRQVGGKRRHLIFGRRKMIQQAKILLDRM
ncbi:high frequency lysogenization protein hflD [Candidatus Photodesmus blepharus]|uniref:High frequency lysogenization protein HflD homolog n=1 Tax=Candidatus Photodesmus blepharonis TaxID=1179155 RepID=A0A084CNB0_9GAMM|nr:high frequency lysogenization protein HflD [Candidatus Photodesmus blepharus]KEY91289.1 high frequency lysogenization protein hflD [Candidatus Photodesmus blepharus]